MCIRDSAMPGVRAPVIGGAARGGAALARRRTRAGLDAMAIGAGVAFGTLTLVGERVGTGKVDAHLILGAPIVPLA